MSSSHYTSILGDGFRILKDGETVDYELVQGVKGFQAKNVRRLTDDKTNVNDGPGERATASQPQSASQTAPPTTGG